VFTACAWQLVMAAISDWVLSREFENPTLQAVGEELILGTPEEKPEVWKVASPITYAED
jgi:hypothetical protein